MYDLSALLEDVDAQEVVRSLGFRFIKNRTLCLNPNHKDKHIGNCKVSRHGYYCFACNDSGDVFKIVQNVLGLSPKESFKWVADFTGHPDDYILDDKKTDELANKKRLSSSINWQLVDSLLFNNPVKGAVNYYSGIDEDASYLEEEFIVSNPYLYFSVGSPEAMQEILLNKAQEKLEELEQKRNSTLLGMSAKTFELRRLIVMTLDQNMSALRAFLKSKGRLSTS